jgi:transposase
MSIIEDYNTKLEVIKASCFGHLDFILRICFEF